MKSLRRSQHLPLAATTLVLVLLFSTASLLYRKFFALGVIANLFGDNADLGVAAVGMTFVILSGGIDLSVGSVQGFTTIFVAVLIQQHHIHPLLAIALALGVGTLFGGGMGYLIDRFDLPPFLVTLGGMFFARGMAFVVKQESLGIDHPFYSRITEFGIPLPANASLSAAAPVLFATFALGVLLNHYTSFGRNVYALGGSESSARLLGVPVGAIKIKVYALNGFCAALAGVVRTFVTGSGDPASGVGFELDVIAAVVIGGTLLTGGVGTQLGTLTGVLIFGTIQSALIFDGRLNSYWQRIVVGLLLLCFILFQKFLSSAPAWTRTPLK
jgi:simple sugar transport system permease protein